MADEMSEKTRAVLTLIDHVPVGGEAIQDMIEDMTLEEFKEIRDRLLSQGFIRMEQIDDRVIYVHTERVKKAMLDPRF